MVVSVVIPSYNHKDYVVQAIESVLAQNCPNVDLIVIDDGSMDGSADVIRGHHARHGGYRYLCRENRGLLKTLNEGLGLARGEFFCELASDDYFPEGSVAARLKFLLGHPDHVAVFGDGLIVEGQKASGQLLVNKKMRSTIDATDQIPGLLAGNRPVLSTGLIRCQVIRDIGGFDEKTFRYYEDLDTIVLLALEGKLGLIDEPVICRRLHDTNVSVSTNHVRVEKVLCYFKFLDIPQLNPYHKIVKHNLKRSLLKLGRYLDSANGGSQLERDAFKRGWKFAWQDPRLLLLMLKWGR